MDYPAYPVYRESGIEWLGKIPDHWEVRRLKFVAEIQNGRDYKEVESSEGYPVFGSGGVFRFATEYLYDGESVLFGRKGTIDKPLYVNEKFWTVDTMFYSVILEQTHGRFLYFFATTLQFNLLATQTALPSITQTDLGNYLISYPTYQEQQTIAQFLDHKTQKIDQLIAKKQTLIDKLNEQRIALITHAVTKGLNPAVTLKDSGVEWLGEVPKHWDVVRLRYITEKITSGSRGWAQYFADEGEQFLRITNLSRKSISLLEDDMRRVNPPEGTEGERTKTQDGDILVSITADLGSIAVIPENYEASYVSQHIALIRPEPKQFDSKWIAYCLFSHAGKAQLLGAGYGGTKVQLGLADIKEVYIPIPPLLEQTKIIEQLVEQIDRLDRMIDLNQQTIDKLKEYRTALITAAVTGKIDLRNWQQEANHANP